MVVGVAPGPIEVSYVPDKPPRSGRVVFYRPDGQLPELPGEARQVRAKADGKARVVNAVVREPGDVAELFLTSAGGSRSMQVWALAAQGIGAHRTWPGRLRPLQCRQRRVEDRRSERRQ